tara:strand:- start:2582 stop:3415 length:834 start_codon:yes stop_codon:yes gene_type:complete
MTDYKASKRIIGTSAERLATVEETPTYSTDFSSNTNWTEVGSGNVTIDQSNSRLQYNCDHSGDDDAVVYDLQTTLGSGNNASDTAWIIRYKVNMSGSNAPSWYAMPYLSSVSIPMDTSSTADQIGVSAGETSGGTGGAYLNIRYGDGVTPYNATSGGNTSSAMSNSTDYYITMKRYEGTKFTLEVRTGSHTGDHALGSPISTTSIPSTLQGLRYLYFRDNNGSTHTRYMNSYIYDLEFYNNITSITKTANIQTNSIWEESDTGKHYIWSGSAWTEVA